MKNIKTVIIVPCYNEEKRLDTNAFRTYLGRNPDIGVLFVDDGSKDKTFKVISDFSAATNGQAQVLKLDKNSGKAEAVRQGIMNSTHSYPECKYTGYWDADLATPLEEIQRFIECLDKNPAQLMAMGARVKLLGREIHRKKARHYIGRIFATFASMTLRLPVYDTQTGAKLFRTGTHIEQIFGTPFQTSWIFDVEIIARLISIGNADPSQQIVEIPLRTWIDVAGSKIKLSDGFKAFFDLLKISRTYFR